MCGSQPSSDVASVGHPTFRWIAAVADVVDGQNAGRQARQRSQGSGGNGLKSAPTALCQAIAASGQRWAVDKTLRPAGTSPRAKAAHGSATMTRSWFTNESYASDQSPRNTERIHRTPGSQ
jgi:hypothetical protein